MGLKESVRSIDQYINEKLATWTGYRNPVNQIDTSGQFQLGPL